MRMKLAEDGVRPPVQVIDGQPPADARHLPVVGRGGGGAQGGVSRRIRLPASLGRTIRAARTAWANRLAAGSMLAAGHADLVGDGSTVEQQTLTLFF